MLSILLLVFVYCWKGKMVEEPQQELLLTTADRSKKVMILQWVTSLSNNRWLQNCSVFEVGPWNFDFALDYYLDIMVNKLEFSLGLLLSTWFVDKMWFPIEPNFSFFSIVMKHLCPYSLNGMNKTRLGHLRHYYVSFTMTLKLLC